MDKIIYIDDSGYVLILHGDGTYSAGCHKHLSRADAIAHWGDADYPYPERGAGFVAAIERGTEITALPAGLERLLLSAPLPTGTALPEGLGWLYLYAPLPEGTALPAGLKRLFLHAPLPAGTTLPAELERLDLYVPQPAGTALPAGLQWLYLYVPLPDGTDVPSGCIVFKYY